MFDTKTLQTAIGVTADGIFGPKSRAALLERFTCRSLPLLVESDYQALADRWGVPVTHVKGVRKVESPRGSLDDQGRVSALYERHVFARNSGHRFDKQRPDISGGPYGPGGYGKYSEQWGRIADACSLDPDAAFKGASFGMFQVLGENAEDLGYSSAFDMALSMTSGEAAHLDSFRRFVEKKNAVEKFRSCRPGDPKSCQPFVAIYNGTGYKAFRYDEKLAAAI